VSQSTLDQLLESIGQEFAQASRYTGPRAKDCIPDDHVLSMPYSSIKEHVTAAVEAAKRRERAAGNTQLATAKLALPGIVYLMGKEIDQLDEEDCDLYKHIAALRRLISSIQGLLA
jgi:hypothetical protein